MRRSKVATRHSPKRDEFGTAIPWTFGLLSAVDWRGLEHRVRDSGPARHPLDPDLRTRCMTASRDRLFAIMSTGYEAELHSATRRARWCGGVSERRAAPQLS